MTRAVLALAERPASAPAAGDPSVLQGQSENLVFEFDEAYTSFVESFAELPGEAQLLALQAVDQHLAGMVAAKDATLWSDQSYREHPEWKAARALANRVIEAFGWPNSQDTTRV